MFPMVADRRQHEKDMPMPMPNQKEQCESKQPTATHIPQKYQQKKTNKTKEEMFASNPWCVISSHLHVLD